MTEYRAEQANDIPDAQPVTGEYDENEVRVGAQSLIIEQQRDEIASLREQLNILDDMACFFLDTNYNAIIALVESNKQKAAEIVRLNECIKELEREALQEPHLGFKSYDAYANAREWAESPHSDQEVR